jgi:hypothetical protein
MSELTKDQKDRAFGHQDVAGYAAQAATVAAAGSLFIPLAGPFVSLGMIAISASLGAVSIRMGKLGRDPARDDFAEETILGPPLFDFNVLAAEGVDETLLTFARNEAEVARLADALIVAIERSSGAEHASDDEAQVRRATEALDFAGQLGIQLIQSSELTSSVRSAFLRYSEPPVNPPAAPVKPDDLLGNWLGQLEQAGIPSDLLATEVEVTRDDPFGSFSDSLGSVAESSYGFGLAIREAAQAGQLLQPGKDETGESTTMSDA